MQFQILLTLLDPPLQYSGYCETRPPWIRALEEHPTGLSLYFKLFQHPDLQQFSESPEY